METAKKYYDMDGNEISLYKLVRKEPDWAVNIIKYYENKVAELQRPVCKCKTDFAYEYDTSNCPINKK